MRALAITTQQRICVVVVEQHRCWWTPQLRQLPRDNAVQRENLGTGVWILLSVLHILERDPCARIVLLPWDHHVRSESTLVRSLRQALALIEHGALWNTFIIAASISTLLGLYEHRVPTVVAAMQRALCHDQGAAVPGRAMRTLYARLHPLDFSKDILAGQESSIRVVRVPPCRWSDLGTPERVARALAQLSSEHVPIDRQTRQSDISRSPLSLAKQHARQSSETR